MATYISNLLDNINDKNPTLLIRTIRDIVTSNYGPFGSEHNKYNSSDFITYNQDLFVKVILDNIDSKVYSIDKLINLINTCKFCCSRTKLYMSYCQFCKQYNIGGQIINDFNLISRHLNSIPLPEPNYGNRSVFQFNR